MDDHEENGNAKRGGENYEAVKLAVGAELMVGAELRVVTQYNPCLVTLPSATLSGCWLTVIVLNRL